MLACSLFCLLYWVYVWFVVVRSSYCLSLVRAVLRRKWCPCSPCMLRHQVHQFGMDVRCFTSETPSVDLGIQVASLLHVFLNGPYSPCGSLSAPLQSFSVLLRSLSKSLSVPLRLPLCPLSVPCVTNVIPSSVSKPISCSTPVWCLLVHLSFTFRSLVGSSSVPSRRLVYSLCALLWSLVRHFLIPCHSSLFGTFTLPCRSLFRPLSGPFWSLVSLFLVPCLFLFGPFSVLVNSFSVPGQSLFSPLSFLFRSLVFSFPVLCRTFLGPLSVPCLFLFGLLMVPFPCLVEPFSVPCLFLFVRSFIRPLSVPCQSLFGFLSFPFRSLFGSLSFPFRSFIRPWSGPFRSLVSLFSVSCLFLFGPLSVRFPSLVEPFSVPGSVPFPALFGPLSVPFRFLVFSLSVPCRSLFGSLSFPFRCPWKTDALLKTAWMLSNVGFTCLPQENLILVCLFVASCLQLPWRAWSVSWSLKKDARVEFCDHLWFHCVLGNHSYSIKTFGFKRHGYIVMILAATLSW